MFLLDVGSRTWKKLSGSGPWPQNLYELTALVYDGRRDRLLLHGGGEHRDELWEFAIRRRAWRKLEPTGVSPVCCREAVCLPEDDLFFTLGSPKEDAERVGIHIYSPFKNAWSFVDIDPPPGKDKRALVSQNRALTYDSQRNLVLMVLGERSGGDAGQAQVFAMRFDMSSLDR